MPETSNPSPDGLRQPSLPQSQPHLSNTTPRRPVYERLCPWKGFNQDSDSWKHAFHQVARHAESRDMSMTSDPSRLAPPDPSMISSQLLRSIQTTDNSPGRRNPRRRPRKLGSRRGWSKLLWVRQSYPDNYVDSQTFLDHLQRNPRLQPYQFWRLVNDSTIIIQHICSIAIFVSCFAGIFQERLSPATVVGWGSAGTVLGWILWDIWVGKELVGREKTGPLEAEAVASNAQIQGDPSSSLSLRNQQRLATVKSAVLIYCAVLGLSPILKSLTKSTSSDSIWAISCWLMCINVFFFDYGGGVEAKYAAMPCLSIQAADFNRFPASLSTNAALMASTVLASRLTSTTHVFSIELFAIQCFGLWPIFRRHLLHVSRTLHNLLTLALIMGAGGGVAVTLTSGTWTAAVMGCLLGLITAAVAMGGTSLWLLSIQKRKDIVTGPWDAAVPRLRKTELGMKQYIH
jgi:phosphatidylinositol glycan class C protein